MEPLKPDDSRLDQYAAQRGMRYRWRTERDGAHWRAEVELGHGAGGVDCRWVGRGETEQAALDKGIDHAVGYFEATRTAACGISHTMPPTRS